MVTFNVLSTKILEPGLKELAEQNNIHIKDQEFISVQPILTAEKLEEVKQWMVRKNLAAVFTSANAAHAFETYLNQLTEKCITGWQVFSLTGKTKDALAGCFSNQQFSDGADHATALAQKIIDSGVKEVVYFCGNQRRAELPELLLKNKIKINEVVVYQTTENTVHISASYDAVLFFSPSAVKSFFTNNELNSRTVCFAIGPTTSEAIRRYTTNKVIVSEKPQQQTLIDAVIHYFQYNQLPR